MQLTESQITKLANALVDELISPRGYANDVAWCLYADYFTTREKSDDEVAANMFELFGYEQLLYPAQLGSLTPSQMVSLGEWIEYGSVDSLYNIFLVDNAVYVCNHDDFCDAKRLDSVIEDFMNGHGYGEARTILARYIIDRVTAGEWQPTEQSLTIVREMED